MYLYVLIGQRKERYDGEYDLEALASASEADREGNPEYLGDCLQENQASGEFDALAIVTLKMSGDAVRAILYPNTQPVDAEVVGDA